MEREEIVRDDFPTARKGWDPDAVTAHLESVAARLAGPPSTLAEDASERVGAIVAAAEVAAAGLTEQAAREAEATLEGARAEAEGIVAGAREEAEQRLERARGAVETIVRQAEELRSRLAGPVAEVTPPAAPQPEPPSPAPDPGPAPPEPGGPSIEPPAPEPTPQPSVPEPEPEPTVPEPGPDPEPSSPEPDPEPPAPEPPQPPTEPLPEPPETDPDPAASTDALLAQLKSGIGADVNGEAPDVETPVAAPAGDSGSSSNLAAARLVAMNLALQGEPREAIAARIGDELGEVEGLEDLLDEVLARAGT